MASRMSRRDLTSAGVIAKTLKRRWTFVTEARVSGENVQKIPAKNQPGFNYILANGN